MEESKVASPPPEPAFRTELKKVRAEILSQLQFLVSAREYIFWKPDEDDEDQTLEEFHELPMIYISGKHSIQAYRVVRLFFEGEILHIEGADDESFGETNSIDVYCVDTDLLATLLDMILSGQFKE